jgi:hypothetical protein
MASAAAGHVASRASHEKTQKTHADGVTRKLYGISSSSSRPCCVTSKQEQAHDKPAKSRDTC